MAAGSHPHTDTQFTHYAQAMAATVFADKKFITGQQLLAAVPERQVNLLILYRLKERWEDEASAIRSPYFDYEAAPVRDAQKKFLNTLSQHIRLSRASYEALLAQALKDTWQLAGRPSVFLAGLTEKMARPGLTLEQVQGLTKYVVYHGDLLRQALRDLGLTGRNNFLKGDLYQHLQQLEDRLSPGARGQFTQDFNAFLMASGQAVLPAAGLEKEPDSQNEQQPSIESAASFMQNLEPEPEAVWPVAFEEQVPSFDEPLVSEEEPSPVFQFPIQEKTAQFEEPEVVTEEALVEPEPTFELESVFEPEPEFVLEPEPLPEPDTSTPPAPDPEDMPEQIAAPPVFEQPTFMSTAKIQPEKEESLGERLAKQQQGNVYGKVSAAGSENLHSLIAIGDRYMMVAQLFGGDMASYSLAVSHVNSLSSLEEAVHYLWDEFSTKHSWNPDSDAYKTLDAALRRKFAA